MREPVRAAHNDYTEVSAPRRVREILPDEAEALLSRRFAIVQVWRAIRNPIEADPLTMCDARSFEMGDFLTAERRYPERVGETYRMTYNPAHEWYYFPRMHRDEALVFKVYDSETRHPGRFTPQHLLRRSGHPARRGPTRKYRGPGLRILRRLDLTPAHHLVGPVSERVLPPRIRGHHRSSFPGVRRAPSQPGTSVSARTRSIRFCPRSRTSMHFAVTSA